MDTADSRITATLRGLLAYRGIQGPDFADQLGITRSTWYSRIAGRTSWSASEVALAAELLGIPVESLFNGLPVAS